MAPLGVGGMGEVYRARDTRLGREVALKFLPNLFAQDGARLECFKREAQLLASLNHPRIAAIYDLEEDRGACFWRWSWSTDLRYLIASRGARCPLADSLSSAQQIAQALEAAHERNIVHRNLEPANIKFTPDGEVKLLDFGLAKLLESEVADSNISSSPTVSHGATQTGTLRPFWSCSQAG